MEVWQAQCPKCNGIGQNVDLTKSFLEIKHKKGCAFWERGIQTMFPPARKIPTPEVS